LASHLTPPKSLLPYLALAGVAAVVALAVANRRGSQPQPALPGRSALPDQGRLEPASSVEKPAAVSGATVAATGEPGGGYYVRPAGPEAMRDPPQSWDRADESSDESFPASDPPGNY
jgi:hypothetical protein